MTVLLLAAQAVTWTKHQQMDPTVSWYRGEDDRVAQNPAALSVSHCFRKLCRIAESEGRLRQKHRFLQVQDLHVGPADDDSCAALALRDGCECNRRCAAS